MGDTFLVLVCVYNQTPLLEIGDWDMTVLLSFWICGVVCRWSGGLRWMWCGGAGVRGMTLLKCHMTVYKCQIVIPNYLIFLFNFYTMTE